MITTSRLSSSFYLSYLSHITTTTCPVQEQEHWHQRQTY